MIRLFDDNSLIIDKPTRQFEGEFRVQLIDKHTKKIKKDTNWFENVITNAGLDAYGRNNILALPSTSDSNLLEFVAIGTGDESPTIFDIELENQIGPRFASKGPGDGAINPGPDFKYWEFTRIWEFAPPEECFIKEIGVFQNATDGPMWSRQLLPTPIFKIFPEDDDIRIYYRLRQYTGRGNINSPNYFNPFITSTRLNLLSGSLVIRCRSRAYNINGDGGWGSAVWGRFMSEDRAAAVAFSSNIMPLVNDIQTGANELSNSVSIGEYTDGNYYVDRIIRFETDTANFAGGVGSLLGANALGSDLSNIHLNRGITTFTPKIPKTDASFLSIIERWHFNRRIVPLQEV